MSRGEVYEHLCERLSTLSMDDTDYDAIGRDALALTEYLRPTDEDTDEVDGPRYRFSGAPHRHSFVTRILSLLAGRRPLLVWLDDLQWGSDALGLLKHLKQTTSDLPAMLVVATLRSDVVAERPRLRERLEAIEDVDWCHSLSVDPLDRSHQQELLKGLLPLEDELASELAGRTEGHPLFAMQLLGHWIDSGVIASGPHGFEIPEGRDVELPAELHTLWIKRIERLAAQYPEELRCDVVKALELAERCATSQSRISNLENGKEGATIDALVAALAELGADRRAIARIIAG